MYAKTPGKLEISMKKFASILILIVMLTASHALAVNYPERTALLNDYAGLLPSHSQEYLENILTDFEAKTSHRILVGIMAKIPDEITLEDYAQELFARWQPREAERNNDVLLVIFMQDRRLRLEVGADLQSVLTDEISQSIVTDTIAHEFKLDNDFGAIKRGLDRIIFTIEPDYQYPEPQPPKWYAFLQNPVLVIAGAIILLQVVIHGRSLIRRLNGHNPRSISRTTRDDRDDDWRRENRRKWNNDSSRSSNFSSGPSNRSSNEGSSNSGNSSTPSKGGGASGSW
jgi:uncharacterized protein